jgi:hypothetical protein
MGILRFASYFYAIAAAPDLAGTLELKPDEDLYRQLQGSMGEVAKLYSEMQETNDETALNTYFDKAVDTMKSSIEEMKGSGVVSKISPEYNSVLGYFERIFQDMKSIMAPLEMRQKLTKDYASINDILHILEPNQAHKLQGILVMNEKIHRYSNEWNIVWELFEEIKKDMHELLTDLSGQKFDEPEDKSSREYRIVRNFLRPLYRDSRDVWLENKSYAESYMGQSDLYLQKKKTREAGRIADVRQFRTPAEIAADKERIQKWKEEHSKGLITPELAALKEKEKAERLAKKEEDARKSEEAARKREDVERRRAEKAEAARKEAEILAAEKLRRERDAEELRQRALEKAKKPLSPGALRKKKKVSSV